MDKRKGGRPLKETGRRERRAEVRLTNEEFKKLEFLEDQLGVSRTFLFCTRVIDNSDCIILNTREILGQLKSVSSDLGRIGNNINQLAKHANSILKSHDLPPKIIHDFNRLMNEYIVVQQNIHKSFRQIYREIGKQNDS